MRISDWSSDVCSSDLQPIILAEQAVNGQPTKVLYHAPKNGFFFTLDRTTGKLIDAKPFVDGINWATGYDMATGRPIENPEARFYKTGKPFIAIPGALGAHNSPPMSYNPATGPDNGKTQCRE